MEADALRHLPPRCPYNPAARHLPTDGLAVHAAKDAAVIERMPRGGI